MADSGIGPHNAWVFFGIRTNLLEVEQRIHMDCRGPYHEQVNRESREISLWD